MNRIQKEFHFSAAHALSHLPDGHQCKRLHGHNYIVTIVLESEELDARGFVLDYGDLYHVKEYLDKHWDHRFLAVDLEQAQRYNLTTEEYVLLGHYSTAELMAKHIYDRFKPIYSAIVEVQVSETPKTLAIYREYL